MSKEYKILGAVVIGAIILAWLLFTYGSTTPSSKPLTDRADAYGKGSVNARITLTEFADFQCPACRSARTSIIQRVMSDYPQDVKIVFRHFPLGPSHPLGTLAAQAAEAAGAQGKFWEMYDLLFVNQEEWGDTSKSISEGQARDMFIKYARNLSLDTAKFEMDIKTNAYSSIISGDFNAGQAAGVNSTPTFFVNGRIVNEPSYDAVKRAIEESLKQ